MTETLLTAAMKAVATQVGDRLPAAFALEAADVVVAGELDGHVMPEGAAAVRWQLGEDEGVLVVAVADEAAELLRNGPPESDLVAALTPRLGAAVAELSDLFGGIVPQLGEGEEVAADEALAAGPGDAVSVALLDQGVHRATIALRLVVSDDLMAPLGMDFEADDLYAAEESPMQAPAAAMPAAGNWQDEAQAPAYANPGYATPGMPSAPGLVGGRGPARQQRGFGRIPESPSGEAHPADFASFDQLAALPGQPHPLALLGDIEMGVTAELGRTQLTVRDVLGLTPGAIIELDRAAGSPVDVVVNGTLIARGEVVVIDEEFGIRITEILGMADEVNPFPMAQ